MSGSVNSYMCQNIEIFVRCQEETATALLDTACSFLDSEYPPVRIYLIDEKKGLPIIYLLNIHFFIHQLSVLTSAKRITWGQPLF